jgi:hydrogenase maturation protease
MTGPIVVIGIGNTLLGDDGVGVRVVAELGRLVERDPGLLPADTRLVDGGTLGIDLLPVIRGARAVLLVDGMDLGRRPGSVEVLRGTEIGQAAGGVGDLIAAGRLTGWLPPSVALTGIQVGEIEIGQSLSPSVEAALPVAVEASRREVYAMAAPSAAATRSARNGNGSSPAAGATA